MVRTNTLVYYGALGFLAYTGYGMALTGSLGPGAQKFAEQLKRAWGDTPGKITGLVPNETSRDQPSLPNTSGPPAVQPVSTPANRWYATDLRDLGGVPVQFNPSTGQLRQDPSWVATFAPGYPANTYNNGAFQDDAGQIVTYQGRGQFQLPGGQLVDYRAMTVAV